MDSNILSIIVAAVSLAVGVIAGRFIFAKNTRKQIDEARQHADKILSDAQISSENLK